MSEEEIINVLSYQLNMKNTDVYTPINYDAIQGLLDLYNKQKEEIKYWRDNFYKQQKEIEYLKGYTKVTGRVGGMTSE